MSPTSKYKILQLAFLVILICTVSTTGILDFQYTEYTQALSKNSHNYGDFNFKHIEISQQEMQFPQVCNLVDILNEPVAEKQDQAESSDIDSYLNDLKSMFLKLLTLTQKLSNSEQKIMHFQALINETKPLIPSQTKIIELENYEQKLANLTAKIIDLDNWIHGNITSIDELNGQYEVGEAKRIQLDFKIDWLRDKINYLNNFQQRTRLIKQRSPPQIDYNKYFSDLEQQFNNEEGLISQIDMIIQKKDKLTQLNKQKVNLQSSISALDLYINDIEECNSQKQNIRNEFKNHQKINQLIHELKVLKKNQEPNIYCEGVTKKLTEKIKTMVRYYAIVASCASDLEPKKQDLKKQRARLQQINGKIAQLERLDDLEDFEQVYNNQKKVIQGMYSKIKDWKIKQFVHDPQKIAEIKRSAEGQLELLINQKNKFTEIQSGQPAKQRKTISNNIIEMIKEIRQLKHQYGFLYEKYDSLANQVWSETYRYESEVNLKNKLMKLYKDERISYEKMYNQMIELRSKIYDSMGGVK